MVVMNKGVVSVNVVIAYNRMKMNVDPRNIQEVIMMVNKVVMKYQNIVGAVIMNVMTRIAMMTNVVSLRVDWVSQKVMMVMNVVMRELLYQIQ